MSLKSTVSLTNLFSGKKQNFQSWDYFPQVLDYQDFRIIGRRIKLIWPYYDLKSMFCTVYFSPWILPLKFASYCQDQSYKNSLLLTGSEQATYSKSIGDHDDFFPTTAVKLRQGIAAVASQRLTIMFVLDILEIPTARSASTFTPLATGLVKCQFTYTRLNDAAHSTFSQSHHSRHLMAIVGLTESIARAVCSAVPSSDKICTTLPTILSWCCWPWIRLLTIAEHACLWWESSNKTHREASDSCVLISAVSSWNAKAK